MDEKLVNNRVTEFVDHLSAKEPVPGGGGASALTGALGAALGSMAANYTIGKKKYRGVEDDVKDALQQLQALIQEMEELIQDDAEVFYPLSKAFKLPSDTEEEKDYKEKELEANYRNAARPPLEIMKKSIACIDLLEQLSKITSKLVISDVGTGIACCEAALRGGCLGVTINTKYMKDENYKQRMNEEAGQLLREGTKKAEKVFEDIYLYTLGQ